MEKHQCHPQSIEHLAKKMEYLDMPERKKALPPEKLLQKLPIQKTDTILDLSAGTGYLTIPASQRTDGSVYALDIDPTMLEVINSKAQAEKITNIQLINGRIDNIPLSDDSMNIVLASFVLHEVKPLSQTLQQIKRVLKKGGYFLCLEFEKKESPIVGPPLNIRISSSVMEQEIIDAGLKIIQKSFPQDPLYILVAQKN